MNEKIWLKKMQKEGCMCCMTKENLEETLQLRELVRNGMRNKRWFAPSTRKDFEDVLKYGFGLICIVDGQIIASLQCLLEHTDYANDRYDNEEMRAKCADYSDTFVHPDYRGNGLQNPISLPTTTVLLRFYHMHCGLQNVKPLSSLLSPIINTLLCT